MNAFLDTLIWLANFPATFGYASVFIAAFSSFGLLMLAFRSGGASGPGDRLRQLRVERGLAPADDGPSRPDVLGLLRRWFFRIVALVVLSSGAIGLASLIFGPVTAGYIYEHGVQVTAEQVDHDYVRFTAEDGTAYTLPHSFFTPPSYPEDTSLAFADQPVVRYLPDHPQAYVLDTRASLDSAGEPVGD